MVPLKDKIGATTVNAFQSILNDSKRKPNKVWVDQGIKFYNMSYETWLDDNDIMKENLLLLKNLLEFWKIRFTSI